MEHDISAEISQNAQYWLISDGWQVVQMSGPGLMWALGATDDLGLKLVVGQWADRADRVTAHGTISLNNPSDERIAALSERDRDSILRRLRFELIHYGVDYSQIRFPLDEIQISQRVFVENLSKAAFLDLVSKVRNAVTLTLGRLEQENWT